MRLAWLVALLIIVPWIGGLLSAVGSAGGRAIFHRLSALVLFGLLALLARALTETRLTVFEVDGFAWMQWPFGAATASVRLDAISVYFAIPIALIVVGVAWNNWSLSRMISGRPYLLVGIGFWFAGLFSADLLTASLCFTLGGLSLASIDRGGGADRQTAIRQIWLESSVFFVLIGLASLSEMNDGLFLYTTVGDYASLDMIAWLLVAQSVARLALAAVHNVPAQFSHREAVASRLALFNGAVALYWLARVVVAKYNLEHTYFPSELSIGIAAMAVVATIAVARRTREPAWQIGFFWAGIGIILASAGTVTAGLTIFLGTCLAYAGRRWHKIRRAGQRLGKRDRVDQQPFPSGIDQLRRLPATNEQPTPVTSRLGCSAGCVDVDRNYSVGQPIGPGTDGERGATGGPYADSTARPGCRVGAAGAGAGRIDSGGDRSGDYEFLSD